LACHSSNTLKLSNFYLVVPPEVKLNPYTGEPMQIKIVKFQQQGVLIEKAHLKKWITSNMPDYSVRISSRIDYDRLILDQQDKDMNKVILFS